MEGRKKVSGTRVRGSEGPDQDRAACMISLETPRRTPYNSDRLPSTTTARFVYALYTCQYALPTSLSRAHTSAHPQARVPASRVHGGTTRSFYLESEAWYGRMRQVRSGRARWLRQGGREEEARYAPRHPVRSAPEEKRKITSVKRELDAMSGFLRPT
jgi:hypothetical protein